MADMLAAKVKTLSFLTYVLRGFAERMQVHSDSARIVRRRIAGRLST